MNHEAFFGPWRPMTNADVNVIPDHISISRRLTDPKDPKSEVEIPIVPTRIYPTIPNIQGIKKP